MRSELPFSSDRFTNARLLGRGSQGDVYRVRDRALGVELALKCIGNLSASSVVELKNEFRNACALSHPNLVTLHELFVEAGSAFFTMELVEGVDFLTAAGFPGTVQTRTLVELARQLVDALAVLHEAGLVHRDIKPGNIAVRADGHLVLLDYGFVRDDRALPVTPRVSEGVVGTVAYMAPEQLAGGVASRATDAWAVGAILHEALAGLPPEPLLGLPKDGHAAGLPPGVAPELRQMVEALLAIDPARRPTMAEARRALDCNDATDTAGSQLSFVGREQELGEFHVALAASTGAALIEVTGKSGVGKTELVRHALSSLEPARSMLLTSRCRPSESVAFQAFDAVIDDLGHALEDAVVEPSDLEAACVLFPTLAPRSMGARTPDDPLEARLLAIRALRRLFAAAARGRQSIVWIDDAQWADADSIRLMADLASGPDSPPFCWVFTTRDGEDEGSEIVRELGATLPVTRLSLLPLTAADSERLVRSSPAAAALSNEAVRGIVEAAGGFPIVLASLALLGGELGDAAAAGGFAFVLARATADLAREERRLLELVALARQPTESVLLLEAAGLGAAGVLVLRKLEVRRLLRTTRRQSGVLVDSYHDKVPDTLLAKLPEVDARDGHLRLAQAHERRSSDPATLSRHYFGGGEHDVAAVHAEQAGLQASASLAFARAAEFFHSARTWRTTVDAEKNRVLLRLEAESLANAGSLSTSGARWLEAAAIHSGSDALELRRRAVESLIASGEIDTASHELERLLESLGMSYPRFEALAMAGAIGSLAWYQLRSKAGLRPPSDALELLRIDTCYSAGRRLADIDPARGSYLLSRSLVRSLRGGDPMRLARSLVTAGGALGAVGGERIHRAGHRMMSDASRIADELGSEELRGMIDIAYAEIFMLDGHWREGLERGRAGVARLRQKPGYVFECNTGRSVVLRTLTELGRMNEVYEEGRDFLQDAVAHHNSYARSRAALDLSLVCLALDRSAEARSHLRVAMEKWLPGRFQMQRMYSMRNEALCDLYDAEPARAAATFERIEGPYSGSVLRQIPLIRIDVDGLRGQLALANLARDGDSNRLEVAREAVGRLRRERRADATLRAAILGAGIASWEDPARLSSELEIVEGQARSLGMEAIARSAALLRGSGTAGECEALGIVSPHRYARFLIPVREG
jgi:eukaryotic-like serine/threonine-protein kinase